MTRNDIAAAIWRYMETETVVKVSLKHNRGPIIGSFVFMDDTPELEKKSMFRFVYNHKRELFDSKNRHINYTCIFNLDSITHLKNVEHDML